MKDLLLSMVFLAFFKMIFEEARISSWYTRLAHTLVYGGIILFAHYVCQHLSLPKLEALLNTPEALRNMALFVMLDLILVLYTATSYVKANDKSCIVKSDVPLGTSRITDLPRRKNRGIAKVGLILKRLPLYLPSLLLLPALFYVRLQLFYLFPGADFWQVTLVFMGMVVLLTLFSPFVLGLFVDLKKREVLSQGSLTLSFITFLLIIAAGVLHPDSRISGDYTASANWLELLVLLLVILGCATIGFVFSRKAEKKASHK